MPLAAVAAQHVAGVWVGTRQAGRVYLLRSLVQVCIWEKGRQGVAGFKVVTLAAVAAQHVAGVFAGNRQAGFD